MSVPRVLLIADGAHAPDEVGEQFLATLCAHYPKGELCRFTATLMTPKPKSGEWLGFDVQVGDQPWEKRSFWLPAKLTRFSDLPALWYMRRVHPAEIAAQAVEYGRPRRPDVVWAVLNSPLVTRVARRVARELNCPLVVTVMDPPEWIARNAGLRGRLATSFLDGFARTLRSAVRVAVASEAMREDYASRFGIQPGPVLIQGVPDAWRHAPLLRLADEHRFVIGCSGSLYAKREFNALLTALSSVDWRVAGRDVTIRVLSRHIELDADTPARVEYVGWTDMRSSISVMAQVDVCYVPYWLDGIGLASSSVCFPNKIAAYLAAGRPLFVHAPEMSSPVRFVRQYGLGECCSTRDHGDILRSLERFVLDADYYASCARATQHALDEELSLSVFLSRFAELVGASSDDLLRPELVDLDSLLKYERTDA